MIPRDRTHCATYRFYRHQTDNMLCRYRIDAGFRAFCRHTRKGNALYCWPCGSSTDGIPYPDSLTAGVWLGRTLRPPSLNRWLYNPSGLVEKKRIPFLVLRPVLHVVTTTVRGFPQSVATRALCPRDLGTNRPFRSRGAIPRTSVGFVGPSHDIKDRQFCIVAREQQQPIRQDLRAQI